MTSPPGISENLRKLLTPVGDIAPGSAGACDGALGVPVDDSAVLQPFTPIFDSIESELSALYWAQSGTRAFVSDNVPYLINNSGRASDDAAAVFFANCLEADRDEGPIAVLEVGAGLGLFARYFLDSFRRNCRAEGKDYYDRLLYCVSDRSERTVRQWEEHQLFAEHHGHVLVGRCDAVAPASFQAMQSSAPPPTRYQAIFANYVFDVLPFSVFRATPSGLEQLCVKTHLTSARSILPQRTHLSLEALRSLVASPDREAKAALLPVLPLLEYEARYFPVGDEALPHADLALRFGAGLERFTFNHGAMESLRQGMELLDPAGFLLFSDYGPAAQDQVAPHAAPQRFGLSSAIGLNFPLIEEHCAAEGWAVVRPADDERPIHSRLVVRSELPLTVSAFSDRYSKEAQDAVDGLTEQARLHVEAGRLPDAFRVFQAALAHAAHDWQLLGQVAEFVSMRLKMFQAGLSLAREALRLNPCYSAWLWNVLGDALFCLERFEEAHEAYLQAKAIDDRDPRAHFNLSFTFLHFGRHEEALEAIARGLSRDPQGAYHKQLLEKQQQVLGTRPANHVGP